MNYGYGVGKKTTRTRFDKLTVLSQIEGKTHSTPSDVPSARHPERMRGI